MKPIMIVLWLLAIVAIITLVYAGYRLVKPDQGQWMAAESKGLQCVCYGTPKRKFFYCQTPALAQESHWSPGIVGVCQDLTPGGGE